MITKNLGGSNLLSYDYNDPNAGIVTNYNTAKDKIDTLLDQLIDSGQDCVQFVLPLSQIPPTGGFIKFDGKSLSAQNDINFQSLIDTVAKKKFKFVGVVPEFWHQDDFRQNELSVNVIYDHFLFCKWIAAVLNNYTFDHCTDLCAELDNSPRCIRNAQLLWTWWTADYFPNAAPCWNATMSLIPQTNYKFIADIFRGADPMGQINWPARINLHAYRNEAAAMLNGLLDVGMTRRNIYIGECFTLNTDGSEDQYARDLHNLILNYKYLYLFERIIQYPCKPMPVNAPEIDILPTVFRY